MNLGLVIGLVAGGVGLLVALFAVVWALKTPHGTVSPAAHGVRYFRGQGTVSSHTVDLPQTPADYEPTAVPAPTSGDPSAQQWAGGDFGERRRTRKGGRIGALAPGLRAWRIFYAVLVVVAIAAAATQGFGLANPVLLVVGLVVVGLVVGVIFFLNGDLRRTNALSRFARNNGWQYTANDNSLASRWFGPPFRIGFRRSASNILTGEFNGASFVAFDYSYDVDMTGNSKVFNYTVVALHLAQPVPGVQLTPSSALGRVQRLGQDPFDQIWDVALPDPSSAQILSSPVKDWLMRPEHRELALRVEGADLLTWENDTIAVEAIPGILATLAEFAGLLQHG